LKRRRLSELVLGSFEELEEDMASKRVFTDDELKGMAKRNVDAVVEAIEAGDLDRAKSLTERMHRECLAMHDALIDWITGILTFLGRRFGDDVLYEAHREGCRAWIEPLIEVFAGSDPKKRAIILTKILRGHMMPLRIEEDDEKFTFLMDPCGSGGRQIQDGKYEPPRDFLKIKKAQPLSLGRENLPVYCAHHFFERLIPEKLLGYPLFFVEPADDLGNGPCRFFLYKDASQAPTTASGG
jgi:hypothetical protein